MPLRIAVVALLALALAACGNETGSGRSLALTDCRLPNLSTAAQCGTLKVPEDRGKPDGRKIEIFAAVLAANTVTPKDDPLVAYLKRALDRAFFPELIDVRTVIGSP